MGTPIDKKTVYEMRYPKGTVVELTAPIEDTYTPKAAGSRFKVDFIDDILQLHGSWLPPESGSMAIDIERDNFRIVMEASEAMSDKEIVEQTYSLTPDDLVWKPLYPNNMPCNSQEGIYCMLLHKNEDGSYSGRKYTIYYQFPVDEDGTTLSCDTPELYILFEKNYCNLKGEPKHPEPCNNPQDIFDSLYNKGEVLDSCEVNDYGSFYRAYRDIEDAKKDALKCYQAIYGFALSHMI